MSAFYDNNITDVGRLLLADIQSGAKFVPTKIVIGSGYMPQGKTTRTMTDVAEIVKELSLNKVQKTSDGSVIFGTSFNNEDILEPFYYRELGLYAKGVYYNAEGEPSNETEEILYSYGNAGDNAELIPAYSEGSITERQLDLIVYIGNDTEVVLNIEAGIYVTMPVFTEQIEKINKEIITIKADFDGINDKIGITTDDEGTVSTGTVFGRLNGILSYLTVTLVEKLSKITEDISENKTSIGNAEDLSSSPTIFGKLAEIKETLTTKFNEVISKITDSISENKKVVGNPEDISTSPTIFGKLAEIKEIITSKFADIISKITDIDSKIGTTTDTGGTSSAGGIFAKLNKLLTDWTTTRASRIDSIYTNTTTNNTASTTGTLSQKLSSVISTLSSILTNTSSSTTSSSTGTLSQKLNYIINFLLGYNDIKSLKVFTSSDLAQGDTATFNMNTAGRIERIFVRGYYADAGGEYVSSGTLQITVDDIELFNELIYTNVGTMKKYVNVNIGPTTTLGPIDTESKFFSTKSYLPINMEFRKVKVSLTRSNNSANGIKLIVYYR